MEQTIEKELLLKEILHTSDPKRVCEWEFKEIGEGVRLYFDSKPDGYGFDFYTLENIGHDCEPEIKTDAWHPDFCHVDCLFYGNAMFDGVRHLHFGNSGAGYPGYLNYPNIELLTIALQEVAELEKQLCFECQDD